MNVCHVKAGILGLLEREEIVKRRLDLAWLAVRGIHETDLQNPNNWKVAVCLEKRKTHDFDDKWT